MTQTQVITDPATIATPATPGSHPHSAADNAGVVLRLPFEQFVWGSGIECSFLPHLNVDQFAWTQHNRFWQDDLKRARDELGIRYLRYSLPWHVLEPAPGQFDWSMADQRIGAAREMGLDLILDVMHFGTPLWLKQAVGDPEFPESLERFTEAIVSRYSNDIRTWCPFNEPLVSALFSGDFGFWPPHSRKWRGYMPVLSRIVQGVSRGIRAIRRAKPDAVVLLCDAVENFKTRNAQLQTEVKRRNLRRFIVMDLLSGRVDHHHPLYPWLSSYGMSDLDLAWFNTHPQQPDVMGMDYYPHSDWQLDLINGQKARQRRAESPAGLYGVANAYYNRYGLPLMLTETSVEGQPINREIWLEKAVEDTARLRREGVPMLGIFWWPMIDQVDWDGALTHRIGKIHQVGLYTLKRTQDGTLLREPTQLIEQFRQKVAGEEQEVGALDHIAQPVMELDEQLPPLATTTPPAVLDVPEGTRPAAPDHGNGHAAGNGDGSANGNGDPTASAVQDLANRLREPVAGAAAEPAVAESALASAGDAAAQAPESRQTARYGIVVFSHLRWGFVWQRPQQFLSRFARKHEVLFVEEPFFDVQEGQPPHVDFHRVMPNVTVVTPHASPSWAKNPKLPAMLRQWTREAIDAMNENSRGAFDCPLLWYYSPMDASWSLGYFQNRGVIYDCMDELSQFSGAPKALALNEARLMEHADVVFTGGFNLGEKKKKQHENVHIFGCGVEYSHFAKAQDATTPIPPDIDFMQRPILGWFGVVDERMDYAMVGQMARMRPDWSFAIVGPVVKTDPNTLPHSPNLFWMGGRDYQQLPQYCRAFDLCMMPFAMNASTEFINPTKGLEYMATGRPIVSTPIRDVVRQWSDIVHFARSADEFVAIAQRALENPDPQRIQRGIDLARQSTWDQTVQRMQELIALAIGRKDRRSARPIAPMTEAQLEYQYMATQGS